MTPSVCRLPECTRLTPWRRLTRYAPRPPWTRRWGAANTTQSPREGGATAVGGVAAVRAAPAVDAAVVDVEHDAVALRERNDRRARLHPRALLGEHEFAARELPPRLREQQGRLQGKRVLAVQILVQAV